MTSTEKQTLLKQLLDIRLSLHNFLERAYLAHPELRNVIFGDSEKQLQREFQTLQAFPIELPPHDYDPDLRT